MGASVSFVKLFGIPIRFHLSWFLIFGFFILLFENRFDNNQYQWGAVERLVSAIAASTLLFVSVLVHELSHSLVALRRGLPVKNITLFLFGGVSQIGQEAERPSTEFVIALVGPLTSIMLGFIFLAVAVGLGSFRAEILVIAEMMFYANIGLGLFNMLPLFPMDGGRVLRAFLWWMTGSFPRATNLAYITSQVLATVMIGVGIVLAVWMDGFLLGGMWLVVLGVFLQIVSLGSRQPGSSGS